MQSKPILVLSGPNLNLLGQREPEIYGKENLADHLETAREAALVGGHTVEHLQSNHEGDLIDAIHHARNRTAAIIFNPGAFTHYSYALADALAAYDGIVVEVHTGFTGSAGLLLIGPDEVLFVTDGRYKDQSADQLAAAGVEARIEISGTEQKKIVHDAAQAKGYARVGLEAHGVTWSQQRSFASEWFPGAELIPTEGLIEGLRKVKDAGEVARIKAACSIADQAFANVTPRLRDRPTELAFGLDLEFEMRRLGAAAMSFEPIVAAGPNGAKPHARPSDRRIEPGELLVLDFGCIVDGYCSDMTRTVSVGDPGPEARRMYDVVLEAQAAGRDAVRQGVEAAAVDKACRDVIAEAGWADAFLHGTGHGVGLEIHEDPRVSATGRGTLAAGYVVTVEPGVYLTGIGGVRIEDTVVVTPDGCEILTASPKDLVL